MQRTTSTADTVDLYQDKDTSVIPQVRHRDRLAVNGSGLEETTVDLDNAYPELRDDRNSVIFIGTSTVPVGEGTETNVLQARNYRITTVGISSSTANPARSQMRAQVAKLVPK